MSVGFDAVVRFIGNYSIKVGGTSIVGAMNEGRATGQTVYKPTGVQYSAILDERVCEYCESLDQLVLDLREPDGIELFEKYQPQQHVNCRCMWIYFQDNFFSNDNAVFEKKWQENFNKVMPEADMDLEEIVKQFASLNFESHRDKWLEDGDFDFWEEAKRKLKEKADVKEKQFISGLEKWFKATEEAT